METRVEDYLDSAVFVDHPCTYQHQVQASRFNIKIMSRRFRRKAQHSFNKFKIIVLRSFSIKVQNLQQQLLLQISIQKLQETSRVSFKSSNITLLNKVKLQLLNTCKNMPKSNSPSLFFTLQDQREIIKEEDLYFTHQQRNIKHATKSRYDFQFLNLKVH